MSNEWPILNTEQEKKRQRKIQERILAQRKEREAVERARRIIEWGYIIGILAITTGFVFGVIFMKVTQRG